MKNFLLALIITVISAPLAISQNSAMVSFVDNLEFLIANFPQSKTFVHTDKPYYALGDDIWYAVYVVNATDHSIDPVSKLVNVILEDENGKLVSVQSLKIDGKYAHGDIKIGDDWPDGLYTLKAYTAYMKNYSQDLIFSKEIAIWSAASKDKEPNKSDNTQKAELRFFPEGGELVSGLNTRVAFEISHTDAEEIQIMDMNEGVVATGKIAADGLGYFNLIPVSDQEYYVVIDDEKFPLPAIRKSGYTFNINNLDDENVYVEILCTEDRDLSETFAIGHIRGLVYLNQDEMSGQKATFKLSKSSLPEGVSQVTLFNKIGIPLAERAFFICHQAQPVNVEASIPYEYLNKRQDTELTVSLKDAAHQKIDGHFSISIVDSDRVSGMESGMDIRSYLLLASEFTSGIDNVRQYFEENSAKSRFMIDILMLTKGWTRFKWKDVATKKEPGIDFVPENGFSLKGVVMKKGIPVKGVVDLSVIGGSFFSMQTPTDDDGEFQIFSLDIPPNSNLSLTASEITKSDKLRTRGVKLEVYDYLPDNVQSKQINSYMHFDNASIEDYVNRANQIQTVDSIYEGLSVQLDEVSIKAQRSESIDKKIKKERGIVYTNYDSRLFMDSIASANAARSIFDLVRARVPGVQVVGLSGNQVFKIRGGSSSIVGNTDALVLLNGAPISYELVNSIPVESVEFIDVLRGLSSSAIYSTPNGVVAIYTRKGAVTAKQSYIEADNIVNINHPGYYTSREFYSPDYGKVIAGAEKPDLRTTLYWSPRNTTKKGQSKLSFYTADEAAEYLIEIQGLTESGLPFTGYSKFEVR